MVKEILLRMDASKQLINKGMGYMRQKIIDTAQELARRPPRSGLVLQLVIFNEYDCQLLVR